MFCSVLNVPITGIVQLVVTDYTSRLDNRRIGVRFPAGAEIIHFATASTVVLGSTQPPTSGYRRLFPWDRIAVAGSRPGYLYCLRLRKNEVISTLPNASSRYGA
jgi:hypothetical protein